ncbi:MAG: methyltransferase [Caldimonas sp.]
MDAELSMVPRTGLRDRWLALRDRLLASPAFQRRAAAFALSRPTARRHARELFDLVAGFVYSQVLAACVRLQLFEILAAGPQTLEALAARLDLAPSAAQRLLDAACALDLVERRSDDRFGLGRLGGPLVGNTAVVAMIEHHRALYADLADPVALLRSDHGHGAVARFWPYAGGAHPDAHGRSPHPLGDERIAAYTTLMAASQPLIADEILDAYSFRRHRLLLDVGGGDGSFLIAAARRADRLKLALFDLPAVADRARGRLRGAGLAGRAEAFGGDFLTDSLPCGADLATLIRVVHDHDDDNALAILRATRNALVPGGRLLLAEPMARTPGAEAMGDAYFGFYLLAMGSGRPRTSAALADMLRTAGFIDVRSLATRMPLQTGLLLACTPK